MCKLVSSPSLALLAFGAALAPLTFGAENAPVTTPQLHTESVAQVGDEILHEGVYYERDVIHLSEDVVIGENGAYTLTPGYYLRSGGGGDWESYVVATDDPEGGRIIKAPDVVTLQESFLVSSDGATIGVVTNYYQAVYGKATGVTRSSRPALSSEYTQKALLYGGKTGSKIKLGYREIWMHITRPSELQFVEYDLADSKIIESNGARIEVIRATSDSIRYRVLQSFPSSQ